MYIMLFVLFFSFLCCFLLPRENIIIFRLYGLWSSIWILILFLILVEQDYELLSSNWLEILKIDLDLKIDAFSYWLILLSFLMFPICIICSWESIKKYVPEFVQCLLLLELILFLVFTVWDILLFYIFFEAILIPMFLIIGIWGGRQRRILAAYQFFFYTLCGSLLMLVGIAYIYVNKGTTSLICLYEIGFSVREEKWLWILFFIPFAVKIPMVPVHLWLPEAHVEAPTAGSVLLAGILLKVGGYGFYRYLILLMPEGSKFFGPLVMCLALLSIYYSSLSTLRQIDLKKIVAYSSIGHMNYVMLGLFSLTIEGLKGGYMMMISHGFVSPAMFVLIGMVYERYHSRNLFDYGGLVQVMPLFSTGMTIVAFANMGFPGTSSFIGEFLILIGISKSNLVSFILAGLGLLFATIYNVWYLNRLVFGAGKNYEYSDLTKKELVLILYLIIIIISLGLFPSLILENL